jgi:hypothetical protein
VIYPVHIPTREQDGPVYHNYVEENACLSVLSCLTAKPCHTNQCALSLLIPPHEDKKKQFRQGRYHGTWPNRASRPSRFFKAKTRAKCKGHFQGCYAQLFGANAPRPSKNDSIHPQLIKQAPSLVTWEI